MATEVTLPRLGQGMEAGTIVRWLKAEGDTVDRDEPLYELDTEKVTQEVEAGVSGVLLKILAAEGAEIQVGTPICVIGEAGEEVPAAPGDAAGDGAAPEAKDEALAASAEAPAPAPEQEDERKEGREAAAAKAEEKPDGDGRTAASEAAPQTAREGERIKASPLARRIAKERGIDLRRVTGTGPDGRIEHSDGVTVEPPAERASVVGTDAVRGDRRRVPAGFDRPDQAVGPPPVLGEHPRDEFTVDRPVTDHRVTACRAGRPGTRPRPWDAGPPRARWRR